MVASGSLFAANVVIANLIGKNSFGEFAIVQSTVLTVAGLAQVSVGSMAGKFVSELRLTDAARAAHILGLCRIITWITGFLASAILLLGASWIASCVLQAPALATPIRIASVGALFLVLNGLQTGALGGLEAYRAHAKAVTVSGMLTVGSTALMAWRWGLPGAVAAITAGAFLGWMTILPALRHELRAQCIAIDIKGASRELGVMTRYMLPATLSGFSTLPVLWLSNAWLIRQSGGFADLAVYNASNSFRIMILFVPAVVGRVGFSLMNSQRGLGDDRRYRRVVGTSAGASTGLAMAGAILTVLLAPWMLSLFGRDFASGRDVLSLLAGGTVIEALAVSLGQVIQSREKMWLNWLAIGLPRDLTLLVLAYHWIPVRGALGLAGAYVAGAAVTLALTLLVIVVIGLHTGRNQVETHARAT